MYNTIRPITARRLYGATLLVLLTLVGSPYALAQGKPVSDKQTHSLLGQIRSTENQQEDHLGQIRFLTQDILAAIGPAGPFELDLSQGSLPSLPGGGQQGLLHRNGPTRQAASFLDTWGLALLQVNSPGSYPLASDPLASQQASLLDTFGQHFVLNLGAGAAMTLGEGFGPGSFPLGDLSLGEIGLPAGLPAASRPIGQSAIYAAYNPALALQDHFAGRSDIAATISLLGGLPDFPYLGSGGSRLLPPPGGFNDPVSTRRWVSQVLGTGLERSTAGAPSGRRAVRDLRSAQTRSAAEESLTVSLTGLQASSLAPIRTDSLLSAVQQATTLREQMLVQSTISIAILEELQRLNATLASSTQLAASRALEESGIILQGPLQGSQEQ